MADGERRPWLIGESPSRTGDRYWRWPLSGAPAKTLCQAAGFPPDPDSTGIAAWSWALYERYRTANVFSRYQMATPWSGPRARTNAGHLAEMIRDSSKVAVLLGRKVGDAFGARGEFFDWTEVDGVGVAVIPHPSGRNLLMNDPAVRAQVGRIIREAPLVAAGLRMAERSAAEFMAQMETARELAGTALAEAERLAAEIKKGADR